MSLDLQKIQQYIRGTDLDTRIAAAIFALIVVIFSAVSVYVGHLDHTGRVAEQPYYAYPAVAQLDATEYATLAINMLEHGVYSQSLTEPFEPAINWPIGYPLLMAGSWLLFESFISLVILQILLAGIAGALLYKMARHFVPRKIAIIPALLFAADLSVAFYSVIMMTDSLFMSLTTILLYGLFFREPKRVGPLFYLVLGFMLGVSILVRSISFYLIAILPIIYAAYTLLAYRIDRTKLAAGMFMFMIGAFAVIAPWLERNHEVAGSYTVATIGPKMLLKYYVSDFLVLKAGTNTSPDFAQSDTADAIDREINAEVMAAVAEHGGAPESHYQSIALKHIFESPVAYTKFHVVGTLPYFLAGSYRHFFVSAMGPIKEAAGLPRPPHVNIAHQMTEALYSGNVKDIFHAVMSLSTVLIEVFWRLLLIALALLALLTTRHRDRLLVLVLWLLIGYFAFLTGPASLTRYRIVTEPLLLTLATVGGWGLYQFVHARFFSKTKR